jgi:outer membrane lipoprotein-sorting protein
VSAANLQWPVAAIAAALGASALAQEPSAEQVLERTRSAYAVLESYSDQGTIVNEDKNVGAPMTVERYRFETRFAAPKRFYFDFAKPDERYVIWCAGESFATWWSATQTAESFSPGEGQNAFAVGEFPTSGTALLIPPLLFQQAGLHGPLADLSMPVSIGMETAEGRALHVLSANVRMNHWSDTTRATKVWIDAQTYLVRKVVQDTPSGMGSDVIQRTTATFEPVANPSLGDESFEFAPP